MRLAFGLVLQAEACMTAWQVMMRMGVLIAFVEHTCCGTVPLSLSRNTSPGPPRCTIFCLICMKRVSSGVSLSTPRCLLLNVTNGLPGISRSWQPDMQRNLLLHLLRQKGAKGGANKARPKTCWMLCWDVRIRYWPSSTICDFLLVTIWLKEIFGWRKCNKRFLAPFGVRSEPRYFVASAVIFPPCKSRVIPCCPLSLPFSMVILFPSLGHLSSYLQRHEKNYTAKSRRLSKRYTAMMSLKS